MFEAIAFTKVDIIVQLLKSTEKYHARSFAFLPCSYLIIIFNISRYILVGNTLLGFFNKHLRTEVHELSRTKILVGIKELFPSQLTLTVFIVAILIPCRIACISVLAEVIGWVGYN